MLPFKPQMTTVITPSFWSLNAETAAADIRLGLVRKRALSGSKSVSIIKCYKSPARYTNFLFALKSRSYIPKVKLKVWEINHARRGVALGSNVNLPISNTAFIAMQTVPTPRGTILRSRL
ncbi:uncharacterized protein K441DRAFT_683157 [Cenococcum geophilum 1.58]|uniref:Uncharacterized protein n=1 Tax=Cenococcum geophilum 1.58 TaxID=794803 RepID=A0ACC8EKT8_9PEZI|nr:hypothetical protein K441DRAFT_683157 [Cenococcum geophilum 1.58]